MSLQAAMQMLEHAKAAAFDAQEAGDLPRIVHAAEVVRFWQAIVNRKYTTSAV